MKNERKRISKLWRKCGRLGRLYWKANNRRWRTFDSDDVAMVIDGTARIHVKSITALKEMLIEENCGEG